MLKSSRIQNNLVNGLLQKNFQKHATLMKHLTRAYRELALRMVKQKMRNGRHGCLVALELPPMFVVGISVKNLKFSSRRLTEKHLKKQNLERGSSCAAEKKRKK